ncbi:MAG: hypothetical protein Q8L98_02195 [Chlamydiales bacterium]|nr:hypothetical protein [Chlamydiales bacterium]
MIASANLLNHTVNPKEASSLPVQGKMGNRTVSFLEKNSDKILIISLLAVVVIAGGALGFGALGLFALPPLVYLGIGLLGGSSVIAAGFVGLVSIVDKALGRKTSVEAKPEEIADQSSTDPEIQLVREKLAAISAMPLEQAKKELGIRESLGNLGGHAGMCKGEIVLDGGKGVYLFLKPKDEVECRNYQIIERLAPDVAKWMPRFYGEVSVGGVPYLVLENTRLDSEGNDVKQLADIKLAGKLKGHPRFNPIADQLEWKITRGKEKNPIDYQQMKWGAEMAPDYMCPPECPRSQRLLHYGESEQTLKQAVMGNILDDYANPEEALERLERDLEGLQQAMEKASIAFIGASIILMREENGIRPILIDPAHIQVDAEKRDELLDLNPEKIYFSDTGNRYGLYKQSNEIAMRSLISAVDSFKEELKEGPLNVGVSLAPRQG